MNATRCYRFITIVCLAVFLVCCASQKETVESDEPKNAAQVAENIAKADELFRQRTDPEKLREAVKLLAAARDPNRRNYETEWKFAKFNYFLGKQTANEEESEKAFEAGVKAGKIASHIEPEKPDGYFWQGANLGEQAKRAPLTKGLTTIGEIRRIMHKVIELDPEYQNGSAYVALGQIELATRLTGGKAEKAIEYLKKAVEIEPENAYAQLYLAEAYLAVQKDAEAKKHLDYILQMKPHPEYLPEYNESQEKAKRLLKTRF
jgi:tetratricopeptide (TPR) repeat protein